MLEFLKNKVFLALLGLLLLSIGLNVLQHFSRVSLHAKLDTANVDIKTLTDNGKAAKTSADGWQAEAKRLEQDNAKLAQQKADNDAANAAALAGAEAKERDASRTLSLWQDRYAKAVRSPQCDAVLKTPLSVCKELTQ